MMRRFGVLGVGVVALAFGVVGLLMPGGVPSNPLPSTSEPADEPPLIVETTDVSSDLPPLVTPTDLSKVDRRLVEPPGLVKPRYCLLVFGPKAKTRVWVIEDGEKLYVDRNANGDLTEVRDAFLPAERQQHMIVGEDGKEAPYREWTYLPGDLSPGDRSGVHTGVKLVRYQTGDGPWDHILSVKVGGSTLQYAGWGPLFGDSRETATVVHFGGPVVAKRLRGSALRMADDRQELHFCIGTPGLGRHSFAYVAYGVVPGAVRPVAEVSWPSQAGAIKERFVLARRC